MRPAILRVRLYLTIVTHNTVFAHTIDASALLLHALDELLAGFVLAVCAQAERMAGFDVELAVKYVRLLTLGSRNIILLGPSIFSDRLQLAIHALYQQIILYALDACSARPRHMRLVISACGECQHLGSFLAAKGEVPRHRLPNLTLGLHYQVLLAVLSGIKLVSRATNDVPGKFETCTITISLLNT